MLHDSHGLYFDDTKDLYKSPKNAGAVGKNCIFRRAEKSPAQMPYCWKFVSIRHSHPLTQQCTGRGICSVINNSGGSCLL